MSDGRDNNNNNSKFNLKLDLIRSLPDAKLLFALNPKPLPFDVTIIITLSQTTPLPSVYGRLCVSRVNVKVIE